MSWLCDVCGYENEYTDESKNIICLCCGEPAPEIKIRKVQQELDEYHREEEKKNRLEELRHKQRVLQHKMDCIKIGIMYVIQIMSVATTAFIIIAFVWIGLSLYSNKMTLSVWNDQINSNIKLITLPQYSKMIKVNLTRIDVGDRIITMIESGGKLIGIQLIEHYKAASESIAAMGKISLDNTYENFSKLIKSIFVQSCNLDNNVQLFIADIGNDFQLRGENMLIMRREIAESSSSLKINWTLFWNHVKDNIRGLIKSIKGK